MFKRWLAVLGSAVLIVSSFQLLWGVGGEGDEHPWNGATGSSGTKTTVSSTVNTQTSYPLVRIYIVRPAPMGGFYFIPVSLPSDASVKTVAGIRKIEN